MSSASSPVRDTLEGFVAGRVKAERVVSAVVRAYYGEKGERGRAVLRPVVAVIERAAPGVVQLSGAEGGGGPGFDVQLAERPFPRAFEAELKRAVEAALASGWTGETRSEGGGTAAGPGFFARLLGAVRRLFSASE